ncbi:hypothetical protein [Kozakia baliensis]|uniref:Uncharacterized protein n=1 Tax=Kozakia baliensis TaxID=153496 RepID=A0A1D8UTB8_9PROT|nr:hypothetical protein [Kozakia baliensis]AOX16903.1 hypothetical protein A0U89_06890 [Kozakia baliensis]GBR25656.1 hypothetical protein AA0488_0707 [Kozakia baliensis NRIC 0488]GEL64050.1 hypothetical protein KBA01_13360 [Kozakia baliensis]
MRSICRTAIGGAPIWFMLFLCWALSGCAATKVQPLCPTLVTYSAQDQRALAAELRAHPDLVEVARWIANDVSLRDQVRAGCPQLSLVK